MRCEAEFNDVEWNDKGAEKISTWNGRSVKLGAQESRIAAVVDYEVHVKAGVTFGGSEGPQGSVSAGVGANDGKGNSASVDVEHRSNGETTVSVGAEHSSQDNHN